MITFLSSHEKLFEFTLEEFVLSLCFLNFTRICKYARIINIFPQKCIYFLRNTEFIPIDTFIPLSNISSCCCTYPVSRIGSKSYFVLEICEFWKCKEVLSRNIYLSSINAKVESISIASGNASIDTIKSVY